jgi:hypothetical protein
MLYLKKKMKKILNQQVPRDLARAIMFGGLILGAAAGYALFGGRLGLGSPEANFHWVLPPDEINIIISPPLAPPAITPPSGLPPQ